MSERPYPSVQALQEGTRKRLDEFREFLMGTEEQVGISVSAVRFFDGLTDLEDWVTILTLGWTRDPRRHSDLAQKKFYTAMLRFRAMRPLFHQPGRESHTLQALAKVIGAPVQDHNGGTLDTERRFEQRWDSIRAALIDYIWTMIRVGVDQCMQVQAERIWLVVQKQAENPFSQIANVYRLRAAGGMSDHERTRFAPSTVD